jgi:ribosome-associated translation inhibitor RaiA
MLQVTFRHMDASDALRTVAQELLDKLHARSHGAERCHLVIDLVSAEHDRKPAQFTAHIDVSFGFPDSLLHASSMHEEASVAVRDAFASVERQLTTHHRRHSA